MKWEKWYFQKGEQYPLSEVINECDRRLREGSVNVEPAAGIGDAIQAENKIRRGRPPYRAPLPEGLRRECDRNAQSLCTSYSLTTWLTSSDTAGR